MVVESESSETVQLLADKVFICFGVQTFKDVHFYHKEFVGIIQTFDLGANDEQEKHPQRVFKTSKGGHRLDHVLNPKPDPGQKRAAGDDGDCAEKEGCH